MKELIGKTVTGIQVSKGEEFLKFSTTEGDVIFVAEGDCCSETWWADIVFYSGWYNTIQFPFTVTNSSEIEMPAWASVMAERDGRGRQEVEQVYGHKIESDRTTLEVIYRNSSNGYYGGWYELYAPGVYADRFDQRVKDAEWVDVKSDWSAGQYKGED